MLALIVLVVKDGGEGEVRRTEDRIKLIVRDIQDFNSA